VALAACSAAPTPTPEPASTPEPAADCTAAPAWTVAAIQEGITAEGATLTDAYAVPAADLTGPPIVEDARWSPRAWWIAGRISGGGVDEVGVWLTNSLDEADPGLIFGVNTAAAAYSDWGADVATPIGGTGIEAAEACVAG